VPLEDEPFAPDLEEVSFVLPIVSVPVPVPVPLIVSVPVPVPVFVPVPVPLFIVFIVSVPVVVVESELPELLPELLQLNDANAIIEINNARLMVFVFK
jgi:hypothetical protein